MIAVAACVIAIVGACVIAIAACVIAVVAACVIATACIIIALVAMNAWLCQVISSVVLC